MVRSCFWLALRIQLICVYLCNFLSKFFLSCVCLLVEYKILTKPLFGANAVSFLWPFTFKAFL